MFKLFSESLTTEDYVDEYLLRDIETYCETIIDVTSNTLCNSGNFLETTHKKYKT